MRVVAIVALTLLAAAAVFGAQSAFYSDSFDIDSFLNNNKLLENYINCMLDERDNRCTREGRDLKQDLPKALRSSCEKCNANQRARMRKVCRVVMKKFPQKWELLTKKYDNDGRYKKAFDDFLARND